MGILLAVTLPCHARGDMVPAIILSYDPGWFVATRTADNGPTG